MSGRPAVDTYNVFDINGTQTMSYLVSLYSGPHYPYRLESKYRYSGLLYDKLRYIFSYCYRDIKNVVSIENIKSKQLVHNISRFHTNYMFPQHISHIMSNYTESLLKSIYFIEH